MRDRVFIQCKILDFKYIISNHWNKTLDLPKIEEDYSKVPSKVIQASHIGLHESFLSFGSDLHVVDQQKAIIELNLNSQFDHMAKISSSSLKEREIQIDCQKYKYNKFSYYRC
jgi:hypothetical protein